jgi:hypothetical protein
MSEFHGALCGGCGDQMDDNMSNVQPTWSDEFDDVVCNWCAVHIERSSSLDD